MFNLEKECKLFEKYQISLGEDKRNLDFSDGEYIDRYINAEWLSWIKCAKAKQLEIDALQSQLDKYESSEYLCIPFKNVSCSVDVSDWTGNIYHRIFGKAHPDTNNGDGTLLFDLESINFIDDYILVLKTSIKNR